MLGMEAHRDSGSRPRRGLLALQSPRLLGGFMHACISSWGCMEDSAFLGLSLMPCLGGGVQGVALRLFLQYSSLGALPQVLGFST